MRFRVEIRGFVPTLCGLHLCEAVLVCTLEACTRPAPPLLVPACTPASFQQGALAEVAPEHPVLTLCAGVLSGQGAVWLNHRFGHRVNEHAYGMHRHAVAVYVCHGAGM